MRRGSISAERCRFLVKEVFINQGNVYWLFLVLTDPSSVQFWILWVGFFTSLMGLWYANKGNDEPSRVWLSLQNVGVCLGTILLLSYIFFDHRMLKSIFRGLLSYLLP